MRACVCAPPSGPPAPAPPPHSRVPVPPAPPCPSNGPHTHGPCRPPAGVRKTATWRNTPAARTLGSRPPPGAEEGCAPRRLSVAATTPRSGSQPPRPPTHNSRGVAADLKVGSSTTLKLAETTSPGPKRRTSPQSPFSRCDPGSCPRPDGRNWRSFKRRLVSVVGWAPKDPGPTSQTTQEPKQGSGNT
ncbi:uncharacterized protein LOC143268719 isoform X2 [Peromyscus maniculatus bairdii]|uniref:uncharacterized protein LOC143268719 isoform X2 n=1 Tax=Peromyscus maniculatus bairdii TaxID=230844 RepID=UPI003FD235EF